MLHEFTGISPDMDKCRTDVMLVIDNRTSMRDNVSAINAFVNNVVSGLRLSDNNTRVGVISFNRSYQFAVS